MDVSISICLRVGNAIANSNWNWTWEMCRMKMTKKRRNTISMNAHDSYFASELLCYIIKAQTCTFVATFNWCYHWFQFGCICTNVRERERETHSHTHSSLCCIATVQAQTHTIHIPYSSPSISNASSIHLHFPSTRFQIAWWKRCFKWRGAIVIEFFTLRDTQCWQQKTTTSNNNKKTQIKR